MSVSRAKQWSNYVIKMIEASTFEDTALLRTFFSEDPDNSKSLFYMIRNASLFVEQASAQTKNQTAYRILIDAVSEYLLAYSTSSAIKKRLYNRLVAWCNHMGEQFQIEGYQTYLEDIPEQITSDLAVDLVKELHDREGVSKEDLHHKYGWSEKTFQVCLHRLGNANSPDPLRIGGQAIHVPISTTESNRKLGKRRYYTKNTMSPVVFQLNLMQVETLLKSFQLNYDSGNEIPMDLAVDTWGQLSDYAKSRIREVFSQRDQDLAKFLDKVEENSQEDTYRFMTESEMMEHKAASIAEQLLLADKGSMICNLSLFCPHRTRKKQRIFYDHDKQSYFAVPADDLSGNRLYFTEDDVDEVWEA